MIDFSHANSLKQCQRQLIVGNDVCGQIANGDQRVMGVMIESHLHAGNQDVVEGRPLTYGKVLLMLFCPGKIQRHCCEILPWPYRNVDR